MYLLCSVSLAFSFFFFLILHIFDASYTKQKPNLDEALGFVLTGAGIIKRLGTFIYLLVTASKQSKAADFQQKPNRNIMPTDH